MPPTQDQIASLVATDKDEGTEAARARATAFDDTRTWVDPNGHRLSDRVWDARETTRSQINDVLQNAIATREDSLVTAKKLEQYLHPDLSVRRGPTGRVLKNQPTGIVTKTPGRGGAGSYSARRLARTEVSRAHAQESSRVAKLTPFATGEGWNLSSSHPKQDICDDHATADNGLGPGVYPIGDLPTMPAHPHCLCFATIATVKDDEAIVAALRQEFGLEPEVHGDALLPGETEAERAERIRQARNKASRESKARARERERVAGGGQPKPPVQPQPGVIPRPVTPRPPAQLPTAAVRPTQLPVAAPSSLPTQATSLQARIRRAIGSGIRDEQHAQEVGSLVRSHIEGELAGRAAQRERLYQAVRDAEKAYWGGPSYPQITKEAELRLKEAMDNAHRVLKAFDDGYHLARREAIIEAIDDIRGVGGRSVAEVTKILDYDAYSVVNAVSEAVFPTDWNIAINNRFKGYGLNVGQSSRGMFSSQVGRGPGTITLSRAPGASVHSLDRVAIHELFHAVEESLPRIKELEAEFFARRTAGDSLYDLGGAMAGEQYKPDKWVNRYMGKSYSDNSYEIGTMGLDSLLSIQGRDFNIEVDDELYNFLLGLLAGV